MVSGICSSQTQAKGPVDRIIRPRPSVPVSARKPDYLFADPRQCKEMESPCTASRERAQGNPGKTGR
ncbi:hypothetical protein PISMIDRAFT_469642 [Pisolithus microcarpus 441]|uniref:Uncharacterized protein n=1 Tax=Pisolithus microcarpus 441 TaxID=765257 RepID=A0A0C9Z250_9AGAM|nr:hypothetical protein PISMIDRAFT_469642 [Pisolithus microcarpus 441]